MFYDGVKGKQLCSINHFQLSMHCNFVLLTPKCFMMIVVKGEQLCNINHCQLSMHCDLDFQPFGISILRP